MRLYSAKIDRGTSHPEYNTFSVNISDMGGKHPDLGGTMDGALANHSQDLDSARRTITAGMKDGSDVTVSEVTKESLEGEHIGYVELVEQAFLPFDDYPAIE